MSVYAGLSSALYQVSGISVLTETMAAASRYGIEKEKEIEKYQEREREKERDKKRVSKEERYKKRERKRER